MYYEIECSNLLVFNYSSELGTFKKLQALKHKKIFSFMDNQTYDLIDRYFEEDLNKRELQDFQSKLATNTDFAAAFAVEQNLIAGIEAFANQDLKANLQQIHQEEIITQKTATPKAKVVQMQTFRWLALAASLALLATVGIWWLSSTASPQEVFAAHYETPAFGTTRGGTTADLQTLQTYYNDKDYSKAITAMTAYLEEHPNDENTRLSLGISYLETEQFEAAIQTFQSLSNSTKINDQAAWYLAMTYLKTEKINLAKATLQKLADGTIEATKKRQTLAAEILEEL